MAMQRVQRIDSGFLQTPVETSQGFLRMTGFASRVGVFEYLNADGTIRRELRLPEEVFHPDSLASYYGAPFTVGHPSGGVTKRNAKRLSVGTVMGQARKATDGEHVEVDILATDEAAITAMKVRKVRQLSAGYSLDLEMTSGVHPLFGRYDAIQRNIRVNHLALVERGRAGKTARVHMDQWRGDGLASDFAVAVKRSDAGTTMQRSERRVTTVAPHEGARLTMPKPTKTEERLDADKALEAAAREIESQKNRADELAKKLDEATKRADTLEGENTGLKQQLKEAEAAREDAENVDELHAQIETLTEERDGLKTQLAAATDADARADAVQARVDLLGTAKLILGDKHGDLAAMSDRDLMTLVIDKRGGKVENDDSIERVRGQYDGLVVGYNKGAAALARLRRAAAPLNDDGAPIVKKTARDEYLDRQRNGWKTNAAKEA